MANLPIPLYYSQFTAKERSYIDYMGAINNSITSEMANNANKQIAANAMFTKELQSTLINNQIATEMAIYNHTQQLDSTLKTGFSDVSRQLGDMSADMNMGFALMNSAVQESSKAICSKLDEINDTLKNPSYVKARELYNRAFKSYIKGLYEEALSDLHGAINENKTDPFSHFLLGQTYLFGISKFSNVIDLNESIESLRNAAKYIDYDAKNHNEARLMAAEIWFYLGLAYQSKANNDLYNSNTADYKKYLNEAKAAYQQSWNYSNKMLESLYNLARCKVLTDDEDGAIENLVTIILNDNGYFLKVFTESDFEYLHKDKLSAQLKIKLFPKARVLFDDIKSMMSDFKGPYSNNLNQLIKTYLPEIFNEDIPSFDMLEAIANFPEILTLIKKEYSDYKEQQNRQKFERASVCISADYSVGLKKDGTVVAIGCDTNDWYNIVAISSGYSHTVGLKVDGTVVAVGSNDKGQCNVNGWRDIIAISANSGYTVGLKQNGTVVTAGSNEYGRCNVNSWCDIVN